VTYSNKGVQAELEHWVFRKVDVTEQRDMAQAFRVTAIPMAIAVTGSGRTLERIPNFVEPGPFGRALREVRASR